MPWGRAFVLASVSCVASCARGDGPATAPLAPASVVPPASAAPIASTAAIASAAPSSSIAAALASSPLSSASSPLPSASASSRPYPDLRWSKVTEPSPGASAAIGSYTNGCLQGGVALPASGGPWVVMRPSRHRYFGHPSLVAFIQRLGGAAKKEKLAPLFVGDLAQARGGPTLTGHASHQTGLDVDVQFVPPRDPARGPLTEREREDLPARAIVELGTGKLTGSFAPSALRLVELAARDPATARVFVNPWLKRRLCDATAAKARDAWHGRVRPWWGHHDHFHVRLRCPEGSAGCEAQPGLPPGDGCDASLAWWFTADAKAPAPKKVEPPPPLPGGCEALVPPAGG